MTSLGNKTIISKNIQKYMDLNNYERNDICKAINVSYTTLSDWINAKTYPRIDRIEQLANLFGITKADLVEEMNDKTDMRYYISNESAQTAQKIFEKDKILFDAYRSSNKDKLIKYAETLMELERMEKGDI